MLNQITPVLLTYNEAPNIERTLHALSWAQEIVVVDSFSTDATLEVLAEFARVRVVQRAFENHADQWNYGISETGIETEWILALDADWVVTDALRSEVATLVPPPDVAAYAVPFKYCVYGQVLHGSLYPPTIALYRRGAGHYDMDGHTQRVRIAGDTRQLAGYLLHDDRKSLQRWLWAQGRYAQLEANWLCSKSFAKLGLSHKLRRLCVVMPWLLPLYYLIVKGGLFDGRAGLVYALQRAAAEALIAVNILARHWDAACAGGEAEN
ncbi:MAG: glycosyltransferase [Gammaproteobacteria bacterium]|nr:glycosyltransferase [Gammaproteobacteria bacterium]